MSSNRVGRACILAAVVSSSAATASAQTGAALVLKPWQPETTAEVDAGVRWHEDADVEDTAHELGLVRYDSAGRVRFDDVNNDALSVGYDLTHLDLDTADPLLPERLTDVSVATAVTVPGEQGRELSLATGAGYAGETPFHDADAVYFMAHVVYDVPLDTTSKLTFTLGYNGNRTIWPDVPLPVVSYTKQVSDELTLTIGAPFSSAVWRPDDRWRVSLVYGVPTDIDVTVEYLLNERWRLFGQYDSDIEAFVMEDDEDRRLFFRQRRLEGGVRYAATPRVDVLLAAGVATGQEFARGWDVRDLETVRDIDDALFVRAEVALRF